MNIVTTLTKKHMQKNKRRTIVTILGIIISVAMFTAVTTFASSFMKLLQNEYNSMYGDWHVSYHHLDKDDIITLKNDKNNIAVISMYYLDTMNILVPNENEDLESLDVNSLDQEGFRYGITLDQGRYPKNDTEIVIDKYYARSRNLKIDIDSTINVSSSTGEHMYTVVGFVENMKLRSSGQNYSPAFTYTTTQTIAQSQSLSSYVTLSSVTNAIYENSEEMANKLGITKNDISYNNNLVYYGVSSNNDFTIALYSVVFIIMGIIMIGSVMLIYNAFAISLSERSKNLGMLSSIGATKKQKRYSVFYEGLVLGVISIPLGILVGIGGLGLTFVGINPIIKELSDSNGFPLTISWIGIIIVIIFAIITIFISTYLPAQKASKISPIEAMRSTQDIKLSKKKIKTSWLTKKLFGFEGELALKNLKRNKKRYYVTVMSLIVSVILFLSVSGFTYYFKNAFVMTNQTMNYDASIFSNTEILPPALEKIKNVDTTAKASEFVAECIIPVADINPDMQTFLEENDWTFNDGSYSLYAMIRAYDDAYLTKYQETNSITPNSIIINKTNIIPTNRKFKETSVFKEEKKSMVLDYTVFDEASQDFINKTITLDNIVYTNDLPLGSSQPYSPETIEIIIPQKLFNSYFSKEQVHESIYYKTSNNKAFDLEISEVLDQYNSSDFFYYNIQKEVNSVNQVLFIVNVFTYGFIALISLISIANIFNTITTSVSLRTKEFAMLKSIGMTPKAFNKMIYFESLFYGLHTLLFSLPLSVMIMFFIYRSLNSVFITTFTIPMINIIIAVVAVFVVVGSTLLFSTNKIRKQNIIDGLRTENI